MKKIILFCLFFITSGCSVFQPEETSIIQPTLLKQAELPPLRQSIEGNWFEFYCEMQINANGDVERAKILNGTGDEIWDSLAVLSLMDWKYSPAIYDGHPIKLLIRRKIRVVFVEPNVIPLAEIELQNYELADSVYNALLSGTDFTSLVKKYSISTSRSLQGYLGYVNIQHYSDNISTALSKLEEGEFTKPLKYGDYYVIFKRLRLYN
ncbi:MAG TPA: hypothetical protein DHV28_13400 [Ignavibacteriales bacterium]|nr:hypothetical protein [Ignavibacteriales bacterium]